MEALLLLGTLAVGIGLGAATLGVGRSLALRRIDGVTLEAILEDPHDSGQHQLDQLFLERLLGPAFGWFERGMRASLPAAWIERIRRNAALAGLGGMGIEGIFALKAVVGLGGAIVFAAVAAVAGKSGGGVVFAAVLGGIIGSFVPDLSIARRADGRQSDIRRTLPEALDLLAIAVQAGLGLEQAIELVARRMPGALGDELHRMLQEVQLGASRREALGHLRERTEVPELSMFALSLAQADALGSPLGEVLRIQAVQMRLLRRQRARERAAKVPVKLLFPLLGCIFPALGIVVIGPAVISILKAFGG